MTYCTCMLFVYCVHCSYCSLFNRYYIAEGVRLYSQDTWRHVTEGRGIQLVEQYIQQVVSELCIIITCTCLIDCIKFNPLVS